MSKIFSTPKVPQAPFEDPGISALRNQEEQRAEQDRTNAIQDNLRVETRLRNRRFGLRSLLGPLGGNRSFRSLLGAG